MPESGGNADKVATISTFLYVGFATLNIGINEVVDKVASSPKLLGAQTEGEGRQHDCVGSPRTSSQLAFCSRSDTYNIAD